ncbi:right-handed parallel beta-helix repeat-containing protein, partial [bacterium]|nr:right-handed parallel beta-helix repeat-containing protein [bacterium]
NTISSSDTETNGIRAMGRDLVVERNVIKDVSRDDSGGIYLWGGPHASLFRGNVVRWNHVIGASRGIYLDDGTSGVRVVENVIEQSTVCAIFVSGGRDNIVERNVVAQSPVFVHVDSRCLGWDSRPEFAKMVEQSLSRLQKALLNISSSRALRERYPELGGLTSDSLTPKNFGSPAGNRIRDNYIRDVDKTWELMDFSKNVQTDFRVLNDLELPLPITTRTRLSELQFQKWFGFQGLNRIENILDEATAFELQTATTRNK